MDDLLRVSLEYLERGASVAAVTIISQEGSTPRTAGARMAVAAPDRPGGGPLLIAGTVGGGLLEGLALEAAARVLQGSPPEIQAFDLGGDLAAGVDMICGGRLGLFIERLDSRDIPLLRTLFQAGALGRTLCTAASLDGRERWILGEDHPETPAELTALLPRLDGPAHAGHARLEECRGKSYVIQSWISPPRIILAGGGHVALATCEVALPAGFAVSVLDDRPEFANRLRFPGAESVRVVPEFADCFAGLTVNPDTGIVILTRGHMHDALVLEQALATDAGYIGMIGSTRKREAIYLALREKGVARAALDKVHCPIGLPLGGQAPGEIAVGIVAEIIQVRYARKAGGRKL